MKTLFFLIVSFVILEGCGKKSEPEYQVKNKQIIIILS